ncbi:MAG: hypothetical protein WD052_05700 [Bacteroidales bacterium]
MPQRSNEHEIISEKTVVLAAQCWNGAFDAGRFAAKMLFDYRTRIVLLNTYNSPAFGTTMMRKITPILEQTAEEDLYTLRALLTNEYGIPADSIEMAVTEGDLKSVIRSDFSQQGNLSIVMGHNIHNPYRKGSCIGMINALMDSKPRPIFLISDFITIIEESRIVLIAEKETNISTVHINYLEEHFDKEDITVEIITGDNKKRMEMSEQTANHFSALLEMTDLTRNPLEQIFYDQVIGVGTA